jgi:hypothetical protein
LTVLLSSLLLFQVELLSGKSILPWFGGSPAVWTISLLVFQLLLLGGYGYAHVLATRATKKTQARVHLLVVGASLLLLALHALHWPSPITPGAEWKPTGPGDPELHVLAILTAGIGFPFFVLATTAPLLAHWSGRVDTRFSPLKFYALSNLGSILALLSYPTVIEPHFRLAVQAWIWTVGYVLFAIGVGLCAVGAAKIGVEPTRSSTTHIPAARYLQWLALAACASATLLATTNVMCQDVAPVALLWAVPLSLYLISFIICFGRSRWYCRSLWHPLLGIAIIVAFTARCTHSIAYQLPGYALVLFAICMTCHGELVRSRPSQGGLTSFYMTIATGGALGGCFVGLLAPLVFPDFWEFELLLWGAAALVIITVSCERDSWWYSRRTWMGVALLAAGLLIPWCANRLNPLIGATLRELGYHRALSCVTLAALLGCAILACLRGKLTRLRGIQLCVIAMLALYAYMFVGFSWWRGSNAVARTRNFYGVFMVQQDESITLLIHAATYQGAQYRGQLNHLIPTLYYGYDSGIGIFLENHPKRRSTASRMRLGVIGLGAGTLAAYGRRGDYIRFYEINPAILRLSQGPHPLFTFLKDCPAKLDVILGDARLSMDAEAASGEAQNFDVLVIDAFNGDEIPVHLLTKQAMEIYLRQLGPDGVLAFHTTNASVDLKPIMAGLGREFHLAVLPVIARDRDTNGVNEWVLLSRNREILDMPELMGSGRFMAADANAPLWSDDYSNVWQLMIAKLRE